MSIDTPTPFNQWYTLAKSGAMYLDKTYNGVKFKIFRNYDFGEKSAYAEGGAPTTLTEGQSYAMYPALWANDPMTFELAWRHFSYNHRMNTANLGIAADRQNTWNKEFMLFRDRNGNSPIDNGRTGLNLGGWVWTELKPGGVTGAGLASTYVATDGDLYIAYYLLRAFERWNLPDYRTEALAIIQDLAQYCVKQCGSDYYLIMGGYRDQGGFELPTIRGFVSDSGNVYPVDEDIIADDVNLTTGDMVRIRPTSGSTAPAPLTGPIVSGQSYTWQKYYIRVNGSFNLSFYPTQADAIANTNEIDITTVGSGFIDIVPFKNAGGVTASDPSYMRPEFFRLFAKYDTGNAAIWNNLAAKAYTLIDASQTGNYWKMPTYLWGVNNSNGTYTAYTGAASASDHHPDAWRVFANMVFDGSTEALNVLKKNCDLSGSTYIPKTGLNGGIWRYYLDTGRIPAVMYNTPSHVSFATANVDTTANSISNIGYGHSQAGVYANPVFFYSGGTLPAGLTAYRVYWLSNVFGTVWKVHTTEADALAGTNPIDITDQGSGTHYFVTQQAFQPANVDTTNYTIKAVASTKFDPQYSTWGYKTGDAVKIAVNTGGTAPSGLTANTTYYFRAVSLTECSLHTTAEGAVNNTNKVNITTQGTGTFMLFGAVPQVTWFARYNEVGYPTWQELSPSGAMQIAFLKLGLNGKTEAKTFYDSLPSWMKNSVSALFVDNKNNYYDQHLWVMFSAAMGLNAHLNQHERGYYIFEGGTQTANLTAANNLIAQIQTTQTYGKPILNKVNNTDVAVPIIKEAYNSLTANQKGQVVPLLPSGSVWQTA